MNATPSSLHVQGLGCSPFARRYSGNRGFFLFLGVLRCFSSPRSPPTPMYSVLATWALPQVGFPIRKSPDRCLLSGFPELIAASHVLHRLLAPRHPPRALTSLTTFFPSGRHSKHDLISFHQGYVRRKNRPTILMETTATSIRFS